MKRPMVNTSPVADQYASKDRERIVEFSSGAPGGPGGLISFRRLDDGTLSVSLYRLDDGVIVHAEDNHEGTAPVESDPMADRLMSWWRDLTVEERGLLGLAETDDEDQRGE